MLRKTSRKTRAGKILGNSRETRIARQPANHSYANQVERIFTTNKVDTGNNNNTLVLNSMIM